MLYVYLVEGKTYDWTNDHVGQKQLEGGSWKPAIVNGGNDQTTREQKHEDNYLGVGARKGMVASI